MMIFPSASSPSTHTTRVSALTTHHALSPLSRGASRHATQVVLVAEPVVPTPYHVTEEAVVVVIEGKYTGWLAQLVPGGSGADCVSIRLLTRGGNDDGGGGNGNGGGGNGDGGGGGGSGGGIEGRIVRNIPLGSLSLLRNVGLVRDVPASRKLLVGRPGTVAEPVAAAAAAARRFAHDPRLAEQAGRVVRWRAGEVSGPVGLLAWQLLGSVDLSVAKDGGNRADILAGRGGDDAPRRSVRLICRRGARDRRGAASGRRPRSQHPCRVGCGYAVEPTLDRGDVDLTPRGENTQHALGSPDDLAHLRRLPEIDAAALELCAVHGHPWQLAAYLLRRHVQPHVVAEYLARFDISVLSGRCTYGTRDADRIGKQAQRYRDGARSVVQLFERLTAARQPGVSPIVHYRPQRSHEDGSTTRLLSVIATPSTLASLLRYGRQHV